METASGPCAFGAYGRGTATQLGPKAQAAGVAFAQLWFISNGTDLIFVTYCAGATPPAGVLSELQEIIDAFVPTAL